jgi:hypothetical protein
MAGFGELQARGRSWIISALLIAVGVGVGYALPQNTASPQSETGTVVKVTGQAGSATAVSFTPKKGTKENLRFLPSTPWQATPTAAWSRATSPSCLVDGDTAITLGVVNVHSVGAAPGYSVIAWVECYVTAH